MGDGVNEGGDMGDAGKRMNYDALTTAARSARLTRARQERIPNYHLDIGRKTMEG
jgi:hypothetical protein